jgi:hypothetical protein
MGAHREALASASRGLNRLARLAIAKDFLADYAKLEKPVRSAVEAAMSKFAEHGCLTGSCAKPAECPVARCTGT